MPAGTRVLGLTTADISTSKGDFKDWGVFGLGELGGTAAMVSSHRLTRKARDAAQVTWRVTNTAVHELGHVLGVFEVDGTPFGEPPDAVEGGIHRLLRHHAPPLGGVDEHSLAQCVVAVLELLRTRHVGDLLENHHTCDDDVGAFRVETLERHPVACCPAGSDESCNLS